MQNLSKEPVRILGREISREISVEEIEAVSGARWVNVATASACRMSGCDPSVPDQQAVWVY